MVLSISLFGREVFTVQLITDGGLASLLLDSETEIAEDDEDEEEIPYGFSITT